MADVFLDISNDDLLCQIHKKIEYILKIKKMQIIFINSCLKLKYVFSKEQPFDLKLIQKNQKNLVILIEI